MTPIQATEAKSFHPHSKRGASNEQCKAALRRSGGTIETAYDDLKSKGYAVTLDRLRRVNTGLEKVV